MKKRYFAYLIIAILMLVVQYFGVTDSFENIVTDSYYQTGSKVNPNIYVMGIDEETLSDLGDFQNFSRDKVADVINLLNADEKYAPDIIAIDIAYFSNKDEEDDAKLVEAVKNAGNVIFVNTFTFGSDVYGNTTVNVLEEPFDELYEAALGVGFSNYDIDDDGVVRYSYGSINYDGKEYLSFANLIYQEYCKKNNIEINENQDLYDDPFYIVYGGMPRTFYGSVGAGCSFSKVLDGSYSYKAFKDSIVFIGGYANGMQDNYYTSIDKKTQMFGVEIHANVVNQMINGEYKTTLDNVYSLIPTIALLVINILIIRFLDNKFSIIANIAVLALYMLGCKYAYSSLNIVLPILMPMLASAIIVVLSVFIKVLVAAREKKAVIDKYSKFLSPDLAKVVAKMGEDSIKLGGERKNIAVLFVDIRNFTTISESLQPEGVVDFLYHYYKLTTKAVLDNEGMLDKFVGDETMGVFNAPLDIDNYLDKAVQAGLDMIKMYPEFDARLPEHLRGKVGYGIGVHVGEAVVGNFGTEQKMEYTAIGDTVNTAARLQGQAKFGELIVSVTVYEQIKDRFECEYAGSVKLKGKAEEMQIYSVKGRK